MSVNKAQDKLNWAILYALKQGCFFPVKDPKAPYTVRQMVKWGAMRHFHTAIAEFDRAGGFEKRSE